MHETIKPIQTNKNLIQSYTYIQIDSDNTNISSHISGTQVMSNVNTKLITSVISTKLITSHYKSITIVSTKSFPSLTSIISNTSTTPTR